MQLSQERLVREPILWVHGFAGAAALGLAWWLSGTAYVQTAVQFLSPAIVIFAVHFLWLCVSGALYPGFANKVFVRSLTSSLGLTVMMFVGSVVLPKQAHADFGEAVQTALVSLFCIFVLLVVGAIVYLVFWSILKIASAGIRAAKGSDSDPDSRYFDFGAVGVAMVLMVASGLEGLPNTFRFPAGDSAVTSVEIAANPEAVWTAMETATTPAVPLPLILGSFPKPVEVSVDEGTGLGANRKVMFAGREGAGEMRLRVTERTADMAVFTVLSDTSPYAQWIGFRSLTYAVERADSRTRLQVSLAYDRELAPAWFFGPLMRGAAYFAVGVLASDVKARAEL